MPLASSFVLWVDGTIALAFAYRKAKELFWQRFSDFWR